MWFEITNMEVEEPMPIPLFSHLRCVLARKKYRIPCERCGDMATLKQLPLEVPISVVPRESVSIVTEGYECPTCYFRFFNAEQRAQLDVVVEKKAEERRHALAS